MSRSDHDRRMSDDNPMNAAVAISQALRQRFGEERHAPKRIARLAGVDPRAARNWWEGHNAPQADDLIALMRAVPEVADAVLGLAGRGPLHAGQRHALREALRILERA